VSESPPEATIYERLAAEFDNTFTRSQGGTELTYITGEQCVRRLNEVLGFDRWSFQVIEHGTNEEADEIWVFARLTVHTDHGLIIREQAGSQKIKRSRSTSQPLDIGFDYKGAITDAMKKCASLIGVGLYLSRKEEQVQYSAQANQDHEQQGAAANNRRPTAAQENRQRAANNETLICEECGEELKSTRFKDGTEWSPFQLAGYGRRKHGRVLCMAHYREANEAARRAPKSLEEIPF